MDAAIEAMQRGEDRRLLESHETTINNRMVQIRRKGLKRKDIDRADEAETTKKHKSGKGRGGAWARAGFSIVRAGKRIRDIHSGKISTLEYSIIRDTKLNTGSETINSVERAVRTAFVAIASLRLWVVDHAANSSTSAALRGEEYAGCTRPEEGKLRTKYLNTIKQLEGLTHSGPLEFKALFHPRFTGGKLMHHLAKSMQQLCTHCEQYCDGGQIRLAPSTLAALSITCLSALDGLYAELLPLAANTAGFGDSGMKSIIPDPTDFLLGVYGPYLRGKKIEEEKEEENAHHSCGYGNPLEKYLQLRSTIEADLLRIPSILDEVAKMDDNRARKVEKHCKGSCFIAGLTAGDDEGTMRGTDPIATEPCRLYWAACRDRVAQWTAFACPDSAILGHIRDFVRSNTDVSSHSSPARCELVEVGAGTGYWAAQLRRVGLKVEAYDKHPPRYTPNSQAISARRSGPGETSRMNEYHGTFRAWTEVRSGTAANLSSENTTNMSFATLLLCYPPPADPMALQAVRSYQGHSLIYIGEIFGDTANFEFQQELADYWDCVFTYDNLPQWGNTAYMGTFWRRKERSTAKSESTSVIMDEKKFWALQGPLKCSGCDKTVPMGEGTSAQPRTFLRDRFTRAVCICDLKCISNGTKPTATPNDSRNTVFDSLQVQCKKRLLGSVLDSTLKFLSTSSGEALSGLKNSDLWSTVQIGKQQSHSL